MSRRRLSVFGLVMLLISACGTFSPVTPTPGAITTAGTTAPGATPPVGDVPINDVFAFVITAEGTTITYDEAQILTGEVAREAAVVAGVIEEGEDLPNDFFISNPDPSTTSAELIVDGAYFVLGFGAYNAISNVALDREGFVSALNGADPDRYYGIVPGQTPVTLHLQGAVVTGAEQVYFP